VASDAFASPGYAQCQAGATVVLDEKLAQPIDALSGQSRVGVADLKLHPVLPGCHIMCGEADEQVDFAGRREMVMVGICVAMEAQE